MLVCSKCIAPFQVHSKKKVVDAVKARHAIPGHYSLTMYLLQLGEGANEPPADRFKRQLGEVLKERNTMPEEKDNIMLGVLTLTLTLALALALALALTPTPTLL